MSQNKRPDIFSIVPSIGDYIIYNPPRYKGLKIGICVGFAKSGLPLVVPEQDYIDYELGLYNDLSLEGLASQNGNETPKTGFVTKKGYY